MTKYKKQANTNERIALALMKSGMTRAEFASALGVSVWSVDSWVNGRRVARESTTRLAEMLTRRSRARG